MRLNGNLIRKNNPFFYSITRLDAKNGSNICIYLQKNNKKENMSSKSNSDRSKYSKDDLISKVIYMRTNQMCSVTTIINFIQDLGYSKSQAYEYLKWAREEIKERFNLLNPAMIDEAIAQYEQALEEARAAKDWRMWNDLKKEMNKIQGNYAVQKVDVNADINLHNITIEIVKKRD